MKIISITTQESEAVERAYYESQSYESIVSILCRELNQDANPLTSEMLHHYIDLCKTAKMRLKLTQDKVIGRYVDKSEFNNAPVTFDFEREEMLVSDEKA